MDNEANSTNIGELSYHPKDVIGRGGFGIVYRGIYSSRPVAIKRLDRIYDKDNSAIQQQEIELMKKPAITPTSYIAMELCRGTLKEYVEGKYNGPKFESEREILYQITQGLAHLHGLDIVHRDINPNNILIYVPPSPDERKKVKSNPQIKLADFGRSKVIDEDFTNTSVTNPRGTRGWIAPELYHDQRAGPKVDIFALGLIFGYTLSGGKHPFGDDPDDRVVRIKKKESMQMVRNDLKESYSSENDGTFDLVESMLVMNPDERPTVKEIANSFFFPAFRQKLFESISNSIEDQSIADSIVHFKKLLIDDDSIDVNVELESGITLLHILFGHFKDDNLIYLVQLLVKKGADVNAKNEHRSTPLHYLCWNYKNDNLVDIARILIKNGTDVNAKNEYRQTPLHLLCYLYANDNLIEIVQLLIENGADVNAMDEYGSTPLHKLCQFNEYAIKRGDNWKSLVSLFEKNGASMNVRNIFRSTPNDYLIHRKKQSTSEALRDLKL